MHVTVLPRVFERHPHITHEDIENAVMGMGYICSQARIGTEPTAYVGAGFDLHGRQLQWIGVRGQVPGTWLVFHAMELTEKVRRELGMK
ncbi:MAG: hypothetical protein LBH13_05495 [Cellulomonadaceae bacterium]|nr:hypothetical protein [Cellulomonadaceae bacterium]